MEFFVVCILYSVRDVISSYPLDFQRESYISFAECKGRYTQSVLMSVLPVQFQTEGKMEHDDGHRRSFLLSVCLSVVA